MIVNFAERAHNHNWELDPVTRSLLDTDFYKLLMLQFIWKHYPENGVSFALSNRASSVRLADMFPLEEIEARWSMPAACASAGRNWCGWPATRSTDVAEFSRPISDLARRGLPPIRLRAIREGRPVHCTFGRLARDHDVGALCALHRQRTEDARQPEEAERVRARILYARAKTKLWGKIERLRGVPGLERRGFRHPPPAQLSVAGIRGQGDGR